MRLSFKTSASIGICAFFLVCAMTGTGRAQTMDGTQVDADSLKKEIEKLKNEKEFEAKRVEEMRLEREQFVKEIRRVENLNNKYTKELDEMKAQMAAQENSFEQRMKKMEARLQEESDLKNQRKEVSAAAPEPVVAPLMTEQKAQEVLMKGGDLDPEDQKFKEELAHAHYNMGNVYFERGEYQRSAVEYYQAVDLLPYDADAHYNLAFVSGEYIGDQETALKHYRWYLYLKPNAEDRKLVEEKIVAANLQLRSVMNSRIDSAEKTGHLNVAR